MTILYCGLVLNFIENNELLYCGPVLTTDDHKTKSQGGGNEKTAKILYWCLLVNILKFEKSVLWPCTDIFTENNEILYCGLVLKSTENLELMYCGLVLKFILQMLKFCTVVTIFHQKSESKNVHGFLYCGLVLNIMKIMHFLYCGLVLKILKIRKFMYCALVLNIFKLMHFLYCDLY